MTCSLIPASVEVIGHNIDPVNNGSNASKVIVIDICWSCTGSNGQQVGFAVGLTGSI
ncbi:hypothetical protein D3C71_2038870 [compost metagenome]